MIVSHPRPTLRTMAALSGFIVIVCSFLLPVVAADDIEITTEPTKWGNVRPARVLDINDTIYVHVVPHTHDDVGWLETVDEYYYGGVYKVLLYLFQWW